MDILEWFIHPARILIASVSASVTWLILQWIRDKKEEERLLLPRDCFDTTKPLTLPKAKVRKKKRR